MVVTNNADTTVVTNTGIHSGFYTEEEATASHDKSPPINAQRTAMKTQTLNQVYTPSPDQ